MGARTASDLDAAFSLLPQDKARQAMERVLRDHARSGAFALDLKWSEHELGGGFLRGGVTDLVSRATRLVAHSQDDPDVHELARLALRESPLAGALVTLSTGDRFAWFLRFTPSRPDRKVERKMRGLMVSEAIFAEMLDLMQPDRNFTDAERRVMFQVTSGLSLRDAAVRDRVGFETKRAHVKSVFSRMHCSGQQDLVRIMLGQLVHLLSVSEAEAAHSGPAETFIARHLPEDAQLAVKRLPNGRILRILTCGPERGYPLVMIHGMMFPIVVAGIGRHLDTANIRLTIPIRAGFLEERSPSDLVGQSSFIDEAFADIALWMEGEARVGVPLLGQSLGGSLAIRFANRYPHLVSKLILQSINLTGGREKNDRAGTFYGGLKRLSGRPDIFRRVNWQYYKYYSNRATSRTILSRLFADLPIDMAVLDGEATGTEAYAMFADLYASSVFGMAGDFDFVMNAWESEARELNKPIVFVHGADDPLTSPTEFSRIVEAGGGHRQHIIPGGHFVAASHASAVWRIVAEELGEARPR
ncbi:MAG: alpha/beta hydrolase [Rhizobiaceae bacterium]|nr:alpha/beta hydrolase [Rhizobiaceae bacterium]